MHCGRGATIPSHSNSMKTLDVPETVTVGTFRATLLFLAFIPTLCSTLSPQICPPHPHALPAFPDPLPPRTGLVLEAGSLKSRCRQGHTLIPPPHLCQRVLPWPPLLSSWWFAGRLWLQMDLPISDSRLTRPSSCKAATLLKLNLTLTNDTCNDPTFK